MNVHRKNTVLLLVVVGFCCQLGGNPVIAETVFFDDFSDGSATDGNPVTWVAGSQFGGTIEVVDGDLMISPTDRYTAAIPSVEDLGDISFRIQFRWFEDNRYFSQLSYGSGTTGIVYGAGIGLFSPGYTTYLVRPGLPNIGDSTNLRPADEDVVMQLDVIGTTVSYWVWNASEAMPTEPLASVTDDSISQGKIAFSFGSSNGSTDEEISASRNGIVRYVHVSTTHIPEPSSLALAGLSMVIAVGWRRQVRDYGLESMLL